LGELSAWDNKYILRVFNSSNNSCSNHHFLPGFCNVKVVNSILVSGVYVLLHFLFSSLKGYLFFDKEKPVILAITAASGVIYGIKTLEFLLQNDFKVELIISQNAYYIIKQELNFDLIHDSDEIKKNKSQILNLKSQTATDIAFRVIADHIRTLSFAIADGIQPGNTDRNYVLRRILRRAVRYGRTLGFKEPFFYKLVDVLADTMGDVFPEIRTRKKQVQETIQREEEAFNKTLDKGLEEFQMVWQRSLVEIAKKIKESSELSKLIRVLFPRIGESEMKIEFETENEAGARALK